jgi:pyruvate,water dikinase
VIPYIRWFAEIGADDVPRVGGKAAALGEMGKLGATAGIRVPPGFAVTAAAYRALLQGSGLAAPLHALLDGLGKGDVALLKQRGAAARALVLDAPLPASVAAEIAAAYTRLTADCGGSPPAVAVRSSATAEDLPTASFAGQHDTYLAVRGAGAVLAACRRCFASLFTDRAIAYRLDHGFDHFQVALAIAVQKMVRADLAASGVMFTLDPESGFREVVLITGSYGLGENIVQGTVAPDEFLVHKPTYRAGYRAVLRRVRGEKGQTMVLDAAGQPLNTPTPEAARRRYCLADAEVLTLTGMALAVEDHMRARAGPTLALDMEWAKDGEDGHLYLIQARPETVVSQRQAGCLEEYRLTASGPVRLTGRAVGARIGAGPVRVARTLADLGSVRPGEVLVTPTTTPDWEPIMKDAAAIVTDGGGRTCHAAIVARELGIPAVVGTERATSVLASGEAVTVCCAEGDTGVIYAGTLPFIVERTDLAGLPRPATHMQVNIADPAQAFRIAQLPHDGVGLLRLEFIIAREIQAHPMACAHPERIVDPAARARLLALALAAGHADPAGFFVARLAEGVGQIAAAFYPQPVVVRLSDFKSNEYASLLGGAGFEPVEENPMLGFRGAARYIHPAYADGFALECLALRRVREEMGLVNVRLMVPFCRRVDEGRQVVAALAAHGLRRGEGGLQIYVMCEIPNNVLCLAGFAEHFDGFSIGSNDLTQLVLGVDRDSAIVAPSFDERDPGVKEMIRLAIAGAKQHGRHIGICGQAPSDYPEMAAWLVELGIDALSLNPDRLLATTLLVLDIERGLGRPPRPGPPPGGGGQSG